MKRWHWYGVLAVAFFGAAWIPMIGIGGLVICTICGYGAYESEKK